MCSDPLDPGGEVRVCSVSRTIAMPDIFDFGVHSGEQVHTEFPELRK